MKRAHSSRDSLVRCRHGVSIVELVAALFVTAILASATFRLLDRSHRFALGLTLRGEARTQLAGTTTALRSSLEEIATSDGDLLAAHDSSVAFAGSVGLGVVCAVSAKTLAVPPLSLASTNTLTAWSASPQLGDRVVVLDDGALAGASDDSWLQLTVTAIATAPNVCPHPFADSIADAGKSGWRLTVGAPIPATVRAGAPARILRHQRYALYRSGSDWMLGWTEWNTGSGAWNIIQPLAGPLQPYSATATVSGLALRWLDSLGAITTPPLGAPASSLTLRARSRTTDIVRMDGAPRGIHVDTASASLPLRNRR